MARIFSPDHAATQKRRDRGTRRSYALVILCVVAALAVIEHGPAFWRGFVQGFADATSGRAITGAGR